MAFDIILTITFHFVHYSNITIVYHILMCILKHTRINTCICIADILYNTFFNVL